MASSTKNSSKPPPETPPPSGILNPTPGTEPPPWSWQSFLPKDPAAMATGLTPEMFTAAASPPSAATGARAAAASPASSGANAAALARLSPGARQAYEQAVAAGDNVEAARILLSAQMQQGQMGMAPVSSDQSQSPRWAEGGRGMGGSYGNSPGSNRPGGGVGMGGRGSFF